LPSAQDQHETSHRHSQSLERVERVEFDSTAPGPADRTVNENSLGENVDTDERDHRDIIGGL
jgi:hypothetical protein